MSKVLDPMLNLVEQLPQQLRETESLVQTADLPSCQGIRRVFISGMGGSAAAAALLAGVLRSSHLQVEVNRSYELPGFATDDDLLIFSSYSGNTEETLSSFRRGREQLAKAPCVVMTSGGELGRLADEQGLAKVLVPPGLPPRASLGYGLGVLARVLTGTRLAPGLADALPGAVEELERGNARWGPSAPVDQNEARRLAGRLGGRLPVLYAGTSLTEAAAWRLKAQINENGKALAYVGTLPELDHNEIVGFEARTRAREEVVLLGLRDEGEHVRVAKRFEFTRELLEDRCAGYEEIWSAGKSDLARLLSLVQFGDFLSVYLAGEHGADPMPVATIEELKTRLAREG